MLEIEAVTVCVGYADYLKTTSLLNRPFFKRWVIVTEPDDKETIDVCHWHNLDVIVTNDFRKNGDRINKGRGIQRGFNAISCKGWVLHLDADIVLPPEFHHALKMADLQQNKIYGCDRQLVVGWNQWQYLQNSGHRMHGMHCYTLPHPDYPVGVRWTSPRDGYVPEGFFQLVHGSSLVRNGIWLRPYNAHYSDAALSDIQFGLQWDRCERESIQELFVWHLDSEELEMGKNWKGRKSKPWGPDCPQPHPRPYCRESES